ncbi:MAG: sulfatase-like hydrolase/transferase [Deltaproteobacteria bacterium]|nr:sulfatase-like hydrolase/transferase [Deltaproteobacteria bacterium]
MKQAQGGGRETTASGGSGSWRLVVRVAAAGAVAGAALGGLEAIDLSVTARRLFVTSHERALALRSAFAIDAGLGVLAGLALALVLGIVVLAGRPLARDRAAGWGRAAGLLSLPLVGPSAWVLTSGPRASAMAARPLLVVAAASIVAVALAWAVPRIARRLDGAGRITRAASGVFLLLAGAALHAADARILVRLYPLFHEWLGVLSLAALVGSALLLAPARLPPWLRRASRGLVLVLPPAALGAATGALLFVLSTQNTRAVLAERAPGVARALEVASALGLEAPTASERMAAEAPEIVLEPSRVDERELPVLDVHDRDLLLITVDALRADHLGTYGYRRKDTSPAIDEIARRGVVFERAYSVTPQTSYAVASLLTGKYVRSLYRLGHAPSTETLAHMLRSRGMQTAAFFTDAVFFIDRDRFQAFEEERFGFEYSKMHPLEARPRAAQVLEYLTQRQAGERVFVWVHFFEPHEPYDPHPEHRFGDRDVDLYDGEIAMVDEVVGEVVREMTARRGAPIVVVTADHGEEFGEHGGRYHGTTLYDEQIRVPLVIAVPGIEPSRVRAPVQLIDVVPTVLGLYGVPYGARVRGTDLRPLLFGRERATRAFAETVGSRMVVEGSEKLVCDEAYDLCRLYDLDEDPSEERNLADARPARVRELGGVLRAWTRHARFERAGESASGGEWPEAIRRAMLGDAAVAGEVTLLLEGSDVAVRTQAAEVLGPLGQSEAIPGLVRALGDDEARVSAGAAVSLVELGDRRGTARALEVIADAAERPELAWRAALGLAALPDGSPSVVRFLRELVRSGPRGEGFGPAPASGVVPVETRIAAIERLGDLGDRGSVPILVARLDEIREKSAIVAALGAIGDRRAVLPLARVVADDPYGNVRSAAAGALARLGDRSACPALRRALEGREPVDGALAALVALGGERDLSTDPLAGFRCGAEGCSPPPGGAPVSVPAGRRRVVVWLGARGDGGRLVLEGQAVPVATGWHEVYFDLPAEARGRARSVVLDTDPRDLGVSIRAIARVRVR